MEILKVEHVEKYYGNGGLVTKALDDVSFTMEEQEFTAIMGASGSGKTTLLNVIATIDTVSAGNIQIHGHALADQDDTALAAFRCRELGFVFQDFNLLNTLSVHENIALPLTLLKQSPSTIEEQVKKAAETLDIQDILEKYPYEISGGQRQRCACARAIVHHPSLILADEPTGALDSHASYLLMKQFMKLNEQEGATILMVTHDAFSASHAKRVLFLKDGKIFIEILRGNRSRSEFFQKILDVTTMLGGDVHVVR